MNYGSYDASMIISLNSKISNITESIYIEDINLPYGTIPIMYVSCVPKELLPKCIELICWRMISIHKRSFNSDIIQSSINFINVSLGQAATTRRLLSEIQINMNSQIARCQENLIGLEVQIKLAISKLEPILDDTKNLDDTKKLDDTKNFNEKKYKLIHKTEIHDTCFILSYFCKKDRNLLLQLISLDWVNIYISDDCNVILESLPIITIYVEPKKTKTKLLIDCNVLLNNVDKNNKEFKLDKNSNMYITVLNQYIINVLLYIVKKDC